VQERRVDGGKTVLVRLSGHDTQPIREESSL
jgi:hypothetical protein